MLQLASIDLDSFLERNLDIYADYILLNQDITFFINIEGLTDTGIWEETSYAILSYSWWPIQVL